MILYSVDELTGLNCYVCVCVLDHARGKTNQNKTLSLCDLRKPSQQDSEQRAVQLILGFVNCFFNWNLNDTDLHWLAVADFCHCLKRSGLVTL